MLLIEVRSRDFMYRTLLSLLLAGLLIHGLNSGPVYASQANDQDRAVEKVQLKVAKVGVGEKARVTVKMKDGRKIKGFVTEASATDFTVRDRQTGDPTTVAYRDVAKVEDNRSDSTSKNILLGVALGIGAFIAVIAVVVLSMKD